MAAPLAKERKSHVTTLLPNDLLAELDAYHGLMRTSKSLVFENALRKFFAAERAAGRWNWDAENGGEG